MDIIDRFYAILKAHDMTACRARELLEYRSPNSLTRIVQRNVSQNIMMDFAERVINHASDLRMTEEEVESIREGARELTEGMGNVTAYGMLKDLLCGKEPEDADAPVQTAAFSGRPAVKDFTTEGITSLKAVLLGNPPARYLNAIASLEGRAELSVDYYYEDDMSPMPAMQMLQEAFPLLHKSWFHPYRIHREHAAARLAGCLIQMDITRDGRQECLLLVPMGDEPAIRLPITENHPDARTLFIEPTDHVDSIRIDPNDALDYLRYLRFCRKKERNHRSARIKPDIGLEMVPAEIQIAAVKPEAGLEKVLPELLRIEQDRYHNFTHKKYHQYHLFDVEAMKRFAMTGVMSDHFQSFRPFTKEETLRILQQLLEQVRASRYLHIYFMKEEMKLRTDELVWYEGCGVSFLMPGTDYALDRFSTELEIHDRGFESFFGGYFFKHFAAEMAYDEIESLRILDEIVRLCEARTE